MLAANKLLAQSAAVVGVIIGVFGLVLCLLAGRLSEWLARTGKKELPVVVIRGTGSVLATAGAFLLLYASDHL